MTTRGLSVALYLAAHILLLPACGGGGDTAGGSGAAGGDSVLPAAGVNYFRWGAESDIGNLFSGTARDCTVAHSGNCSMRLDVRGDDSGNQQMGVDGNQIVYPFSFVGAPALYYRWWMRIEPGFSWGSGTAKTKSSRTIAGSAAQGYTGYLMSFGFLLGECGSGGCRLANGDINTDENLYIPFDFRSQDDGVWHEYIVKVRPNTRADCAPAVNCDGQFQAWVDGVSVGEYHGFKLHDDAAHGMTEAWQSWMVTPYFQLNGTAADGGVIYVDDFSTDTALNSSRGN